MELSSFGQVWSSSLGITLGAQKLKRQDCPQTDQKGHHPLKHHYVLDANDPQCHESSTVSLPCVRCALFDAVTLLSSSQEVKPRLNCRSLEDTQQRDTSVPALQGHHLSRNLCALPQNLQM